MSSGTPWSVKGIDPRARAVAKTAARKEGMTLGEWLNRVILDDDGNPTDWDGSLESYPGFGGGGGGGGDDDDALRAVIDRLTGRLEAAERRSTLVLSGVDQSVLALTRRLEALENGSLDSEAVDSALARTRSQQDELLERVRKLERSGPGGDTPALKAMENTVGKLAGRMYETERDVRAELDNLTHKEELRRETSEKALRGLSERLDDNERRLTTEQRELRERLAEEQRQAADFRSSLEGQSRSLQSRIIAAESATHRAAEALVQSQERLDGRLRTLESKGPVGAEDLNQRFETLGRELAGLIRDTREEFGQRVAEVANAGVDGQRLERALEAAEARLTQAEARQSETLNRIGEEVARLARAVDRRIEDAERRLEQKLTDTAERQDGNRSRAEFDSRLERIREENTAAVRRIGEQMARLGENLADRVQQAELRSAAAVEQAGERMAQVVEKLETRQAADQGADLETRIQASEERTAQRIDQAMDRVHERLDKAREETADALSPVQRAMTALADRLEAIEQGKTGGADRTDATSAKTPEDAIDLSTPLPQAPPLTPDSTGKPDPWERNGGGSFVVEADSAPLSPLPQAPLVQDTPEEPLDFGDAPDPAPRQQRQQARRPAALGATADSDFMMTARQSVRPGGSTARPQWNDPEESQAGGGRILLITASILGFGAVAAAAGMLALEAFGGGGLPASRQVQAGNSESVASVFAEPAPPPSNTPTATTPSRLPETRASETVASPDEVSAAPVEAAAEAPPPPGAANIDPDAGLIAAVSVEVPSLETAASAGDPIARYQLGVRLIERGQTADGAALLRRAAEQGIPEAMRRYGLMLTRGDGVAQDVDAGQDFVIRAAEAGNVLAMHDAGGLFINAPETAETQAAAARWFQEAALHGHSDSQFNMALLFQEGFGVPQSAADAYTWFLIASAGGDVDAGGRASRIRQSLNPAARAEAEQIAQTFTPRTTDPAAQGQYPNLPWNSGPEFLTARAQTLLGNLGYDAGPADGVLGERTRRAIVRYQRDTGLEPGSNLTASLVARLEQSAAN